MSFGQKVREDILRNHRLICFPALEDRLRLAHTLVSVILFLHQISWLHKALNASNIIFFPPEDSPHDKWIRNPFIVGFMHSRKNEENPFTQGPQEGREFQDYQHPEYLDNENAVYMPKYDYYSLGILLLEIGIWDSLSSIVASQIFQGIGHETFRRRLLEKRMPQLRQATGSIYAAATRVCLESAFDSSQPRTVESLGVSSALYDSFRRLVVDPIAECRV